MVPQKVTKTFEEKIMIEKMILVTVLMTGIIISTASPTPKQAAVSYVLSSSGEQIESAEIVNPGNESSSNITGQQGWRYVGYLSVRLDYATGLWDKDGYNDWSDPYVVITAYQQASIHPTVRNTRIVWDTSNPYWYQTLHFGHVLGHISLSEYVISIRSFGTIGVINW